MKKLMLGSLVVLGFLVFSPQRSLADSLVNDFVDETESVFVGEDGEVIPLSEIGNEVSEFDGMEGPDLPQSRSASGYTYKNHTTLSTKTYTNKLLKTLGTSNVWGTASNSIRPTLTLSISKSYSVSVGLSNGTGNFTFSGNVSLSANQSYSAQPNVKGNRVSIGLYAKTVTTKRVRIAAYSNGSGKFSHYIYSNPTTISGTYIGQAFSK